MKKLLSIITGAVMASALVVSTVAAVGAGQVEAGDIYRVKNVTKGGDFTDPASATCGDTVQYKVRIHNPGPDSLGNVTVTATLPGGVATTHVSKVTVSSPNADPASTSDTATVNLDKAGKLSYVAGSTELLDHNGARVNGLGDTITSSGVNIGNVGVSLQQKRFVQFKAKVTCEEAPKNIKVCELATKQVITIKENEFDSAKHSKNLNDCKKEVPGKITVCELATKTVVTINEGDFDAKKHSKDLNDCEEAPVETPQVIAATGPAGTIASMFGLSALTAGIGYAVQRRRNILG